MFIIDSGWKFVIFNGYDFTLQMSEEFFFFWRGLG